MFAFGNSMGDYAMLDATSDSQLPSLVCILDHYDAEREYEYHNKTLLKEAQSRGWLVVSMNKDFHRVFADEYRVEFRILHIRKGSEDYRAPEIM